MSRIGRQPIPVPETVTVDLAAGWITTKGPKGELKLQLPTGVTVKSQDNTLRVSIPDAKLGHLQGLTRTLIANLITGVTTGWHKTLELSGTGYRAASSGDELNLALGFSHPVVIKAPLGISFETKENKIIVSGADKVLVGEVAARIRRLRPADPYKAKGFKYEGEIIRRKAGKAAKTGAAAGATK